MINALPILFPAIGPQIEESKKPSTADGPTLDNPAKTMEVTLPEHKAQLSLSAHAQLVFLTKRTRRWHAALAGAIAGCLAIIWEKRSRRDIIAQQLFVRYVFTLFLANTTNDSTPAVFRDLIIRFQPNTISTFLTVMYCCSRWRKYARLDNGESTKARRRCGQILYAFLVRPDTLDQSYRAW